MVQFSSCLATTAVSALLLSTAYAAPLTTSQSCQTSPATAQSNTKVPKAIYFITNAKQNAVVAMNVAADGTLSDGSVTSTGGAGLSGVDGKGNAAAPDSLFSQGAIKVSGNTLIAVNPGSNSISMFTFSSTNPTKLTAVGAPVNTLGDFPTSLSISSKLNQACVANTGAKAGISCFHMTSSGLVSLDTAAGLRPFNLNQTTPPSGPLNTVSQVFFNADSSALLATVKGDGAANKGFLASFAVHRNHTVSHSASISSPNGTAVLFGTALIPGRGNGNKLFVTDASFGSATLSLGSRQNNHTASVSAKTAISGQGATCWATISALTNTAFVTDVTRNHLVEVDTATGAIVSDLNLDANTQVGGGNGNVGMIDLEAAGKFVYVLSPGNGTASAAEVRVVDVSAGKGTGKVVQNFVVGGGASGGGSAQGIAVFMG